MAKPKHITRKNLPSVIHPLNGIVVVWFLWDKLPYEWAHTLLIAGIIIYLPIKILALFWEEEVDVLKG